MIAFGNPLPRILEPEELAARPKLDRNIQISCTTPNANDNSHYDARRFNLERRSYGLDSIQVRSLRCIVPVEIAAQSLNFFYEAIALKASRAWRNSPPERALTITVGNMVLSLLSDAPIPWDFVIYFADSKLHATKLGATNTYNIIYQGPRLISSVAITLRVIDHITSPEARFPSTQVLEAAEAHKDHLFADLRTGLRVRKQKEYQAVLTSRSLSLPSNKAAKPPALNIKPRTPPLITASESFKLERFHVTAIITPVITAARFLEDFYDLIALKVETGVWKGVPPLHSLALTRWDYRLKFFCYAAPIPWDFIQEVAIEMSEWAAKGFTAQYDAVYKAVDQFGKEIFVSVALEFMDGKINKDDTKST